MSKSSKINVKHVILPFMFNPDYVTFASIGSDVEEAVEEEVGGAPLPPWPGPHSRGTGWSGALVEGWGAPGAP